MELSNVLKRIERRLAAVGMSADAASKAAGKPDAIRNLRRAVRSGERQGVSTSTIAALAPALDTSVGWLLEGIGDEELGRSNIVGVVGLISAGGSIETGDEHTDPSGNLFEIEVPFPVPEGAIAFQVKGDSMWPRYDPDDIVVCSRPSDDPRRLIGWEAAVATPEGNRYLKRLLEGGKPGLFTLESHNAPPIRDVRLSWASDVYATVRAQRWHRLDTAGRKRLIRRAVQAAE